MALFTSLTKWSEYLGSQLAAAEVDERYAEAAVDRAKVIFGVDGRSKEGRAAANNDEYLGLQDTYQEKMAYRKLINVMFENMERRSTLLSRELTRRVNRSDREGRVDRWHS